MREASQYNYTLYTYGKACPYHPVPAQNHRLNGEFLTTDGIGGVVPPEKHPSSRIVP
ncbi:hypothetical protein ACFL6S_01330 [Candidatus Poribacteria bacterium]